MTARDRAPGRTSKPASKQAILDLWREVTQALDWGAWWHAQHAIRAPRRIHGDLTLYRPDGSPLAWLPDSLGERPIYWWDAKANQWLANPPRTEDDVRELEAALGRAYRATAA